MIPGTHTLMPDAPKLMVGVEASEWPNDGSRGETIAISYGPTLGITSENSQITAIGRLVWVKEHFTYADVMESLTKKYGEPTSEKKWMLQTTTRWLFTPDGKRLKADDKAAKACEPPGFSFAARQIELPRNFSEACGMTLTASMTHDKDRRLVNEFAVVMYDSKAAFDAIARFNAEVKTAAEAATKAKVDAASGRKPAL